MARRPQGEARDITIGLDIAGPRADLTVCTAVADGTAILKQEAWTAAEPMGYVVEFIKRFGSRVKLVRGDEAGGGFHFISNLRKQLPGISVVGVNVGREPSDKEHFRNLKAELYWKLRERFREGSLIGLNEETFAELATLTYGLTDLGKVEIESKDSLKRRGIKSPDRAESLMLAVGPDAWGLSDAGVIQTMPSKRDFWHGGSSGSGGHCPHGIGAGCVACQDAIEDAANVRGIPSGAVTCRVPGPRSLRGL